MYCVLDPTAEELALLFCKEAEELWDAERKDQRDSTMTMAATVFLCLGYLGQGRDDSVLKYLAEVTQMGTRLGLFGVEDKDKAVHVQNVDVYTAWGVFNWTVCVAALLVTSPLYRSRLNGITGSCLFFIISRELSYPLLVH